MYPIPANATRIRYLESTGTQYVDTGIVPTLSDAVSVDADMVLTTIKTNDNNILFGSYYDNNVAGASTAFQSRLFAFVDSSRKARIAYGGAASGTVAVSAGDRLAVSAQFAAGNSRLLINGVQSSASSSSPTVLPNIAIWIFRAAYGIPTVTVSPCSARLYSLMITVNGVLVRSYIPVRIGSVGYLFDRASGTLFGNAGTGAFVLGPDTFSQGVVPTRMMAMGVRKKLPTTWDYVQDGLYYQLDGIENAGRGVHDATATVWRDLAGDRNFAISLTNAEWEDDALYAKNRNAATMEFLPFSSSYTIQFVVKQLFKTSYGNNSAYVILGLNVSRYYGLLFRGSVDALMVDRAYYTGSAMAGYRCLSFSDIANTSSKMWADGVTVDASGYNSLDYTAARGDVARVGGTGELDKPIKLHAIRIYNRALTAAEIAHNYAIDKARFNLP